MIAQLEAEEEAQMFTTLVDVSLTDSDRGKGGGWNSETRLHVLAYEIALYMPDLASSLSKAGRDRLLAVAWKLEWLQLRREKLEKS
jgi:hypothetical protein